MTFNELELPGVYLIDLLNFTDDRGDFIKTFHYNSFRDLCPEYDFKESYFSISKKNVIRGMHFQLPPHDHAKFVYITDGEAMDVILDLRKNSPTYKQYITIPLSSEKYQGIYMPKGLAHGFLSKKENTKMIYLTTAIYHKEYDSGIMWDSFGLDWGVNNPVISERDKNLILLAEFKTPF